MHNTELANMYNAIKCSNVELSTVHLTLFYVQYGTGWDGSTFEWAGMGRNNISVGPCNCIYPILCDVPQYNTALMTGIFCRQRHIHSCNCFA